MKIAVYSRPEYGGTGLYRLYMPYEKLSKEGHKITFSDSRASNFYDCDIFVASKSWFLPALGVVTDLKKQGVKTVIDFDDFWVLPQSHLLYKNYKDNATSQILINALRQFDYVTCTTERLRDEIYKINKNVVVLENAVDTSLPQFNHEPTKSDQLRFGWVGGHCHLPDIEMLNGQPQKLTGDFNVSLCGFDNSDVFKSFAEILSGQRQLVPDKFTLYQKLTARQYTQFYNHFDVALAPLVKDTFNSMKSELKLVEAGFMKKGLIASDVAPYSDLLTSKNSLKCTHKNHWAKNMQRLINNPSQVDDMADALYETVKDKFDLNNVNKRREEWLNSIL